MSHTSLSKSCNNRDPLEDSTTTSYHYFIQQNLSQTRFFHHDFNVRYPLHIITNDLREIPLGNAAQITYIFSCYMKPGWDALLKLWIFILSLLKIPVFYNDPSLYGTGLIFWEVRLNSSST